MHPNFAFSATQILWTLTFAAQLVLLVVLLGRDRINRYPWFSASIVLFALRLLTEVLLGGRLPQMTLRSVFISFADLTALLSLAVVVEIARRAFAGAPRGVWVGWSLAAMVVAGGVLYFWGPWPARAELAADSPLALLRLMQFVAQKMDMLVDVLSIELGLLVLAAGRRYKAGWRSHTQAIAIGLSTVAVAWLSVQGAWQVIARTVHPLTRADYERVINLGNKLVNANKVVYIAVLVWWILWLWFDEPGATETGSETPVEESATDGQAALLTEWPSRDEGGETEQA
jgi:hypothetical protein